MSQAWYPYCDAKTYSQEADEVIQNYDYFSELCVIQDQKYVNRMEDCTDKKQGQLIPGWDNPPSEERFEEVKIDQLYIYENLKFKSTQLPNLEYQKLFRNIFAYKSAIDII